MIVGTKAVTPNDAKGQPTQFGEGTSIKPKRFA
jgi:hypothetical protein